MGLLNDKKSRTLHFSVVKHRLVTKTNEIYTAQAIVLKNQYGIPVSYTGLEVFAQQYEARKLQRYDYTREHYLLYDVLALEYIYTNNATVDSVQDISADMVLDFLSDYADPQYGRSPQSIRRCTNAVSHFFANVFHMTKTHDPELLVKAEFCRTNRRSGKETKRYIPVFSPYIRNDGKNEIFRDIPVDAMSVILDVCQRNYPQIYFAVLCQTLTGLRPSEVLNLRQEESIYGGNIRIAFVDCRICDIVIDLTKEYLMRADGKRVGGIKKHRKQRVFPLYYDEFYNCLSWHLNWLTTQKYDKNICPMFPNRDGKAMTYISYRQAFLKLMVDVQKKLECSDNPVLRRFAMRLEKENLCPHALRHYFTVSLVLLDADIPQIMTYRGDTDPTSALTYVINKGELARKTQSAADDVNVGFMAIGRMELDNGKKLD